MGSIKKSVIRPSLLELLLAVQYTNAGKVKKKKCGIDFNSPILQRQVEACITNIQETLSLREKTMTSKHMAEILRRERLFLAVCDSIGQWFDTHDLFDQKGNKLGAPDFLQGLQHIARNKNVAILKFIDMNKNNSGEDILSVHVPDKVMRTTSAKSTKVFAQNKH